MCFLLIHKSNEALEAGIPPPPERIAQIHAFMQEVSELGVLLAAEGVHASAKGARLSYKQGDFIVTDGPFPEAKELIAGFLLIQVPSKQAAIECAKRFAECMGEIEIEIRQVVELEDLPS
jgi:hypothetical protein